MKKIIYAKDYVTLPCEDAAEGLRRAIQAAKEQHADVLQLETGIYPLKTWIQHTTDQSGHDAGAVMTDEKDVLLLINGFSGLELCGAVDEAGEPATILAGVNPGELHTLLPSILWCEDCSRLTVRNLRFTRTPNFCSARRVSAIAGDTISVDVLDGNPCLDGMGTHCMNRFSPDGSTLVGESLSYGPGLGTVFRKTGERTLSLTHEKTAKRLEVGDILTWHQGGKTDFQCFFGHCENLVLENLRTDNANGFAMLAFDIHNLTADRVVFKPDGNQKFTAPRDAWKLHKCSGEIHISRLYVEGVRMDGQNVHNNYMFVIGRTAPDQLLMESENAKTVFRCGAGEARGIEFFRDEKTIGRAELKSCQHISTRVEGGRNLQRYLLTFDEPLDFDTDGEVTALADCFTPEIYECRDSVFRNIAGAGHLLRTGHVRITNCTYQNLMNPGILMGDEYPTFHEGGHCYDVLIRGCRFENCGFFPRYGTQGCIGIHAYGFQGPVNHDIHIEDCSFSHAEIGIDIRTAEDVTVKNCQYSELLQDIRLR
ncbi:MAG: right-handed parallel beta-helix repeat-containing protein [Clostridia bacterium]|nr:right-handed parallel beta-helix repeat-containing protein [Clostridia bacterium]